MIVFSQRFARCTERPAGAPASGAAEAGPRAARAAQCGAPLSVAARPVPRMVTHRHALCCARRAQEASEWEGALISSTSRLLLPIDELYVPKEGVPSTDADLVRTFDNGAASLATRLRGLVQAEVEEHSSEIAR